MTSKYFRFYICETYFFSFADSIIFKGNLEENVEKNDSYRVD